MSSQPRDAAPVQLACDRCTQGVMDSTNPHLLGTCACPCHQDPTQRVEATTTPEGREGWDEPRHPEAGEAMASLPPLRAGADAIPEGVRAEIRDEEDGDGRDPGSAPTAAPVFSSGYGMETCPTHHRWIKIERADGTTADRRCPECPRPRGARIVNQFTHEVVGRMPPELKEEAS